MLEYKYERHCYKQKDIYVVHFPIIYLTLKKKKLTCDAREWKTIALEIYAVSF